MEPSPAQAPMDFRNLRIICFALLASVVLCNVVLTILYATGQLAEKEIKKPVPLIFFSLALLLLVSAPAIKRALLKRSGAELLDVSERAGDYMSANIIAFAMREGAGLMGFVLSLLTGNPWWSWGLGGAAVLSMIVDWPRGNF
ncbi:MAG TPA: hypothetical protein VF789_27660 [Thermoanaerobaculia bacterium]